MYIEQLSEDEIKHISKQLLLIVEHDDEAHVDNMILGTNFERDKYGISGILPITTEADISLRDFYACISYGGYGSEEKINKKFRSFMYNKFGEQYLLDLKAFYKQPIEEKYQKALKELDDTINSIMQ